MCGSTNETCLPIESGDSGNSNPNKSMSGCVRVAQLTAMVERGRDGLVSVGLDCPMP